MTRIADEAVTYIDDVVEFLEAVNRGQYKRPILPAEYDLLVRGRKAIQSQDTISVPREVWDTISQAVRFYKQDSDSQGVWKYMRTIEDAIKSVEGY